jgi:hypothetical protein
VGLLLLFVMVEDASTSTQSIRMKPKQKRQALQWILPRVATMSER